MPDRYLGANYAPSGFARSLLVRIGSDVNDAIHVVRNYEDCSQGTGASQWWYRGTSQHGRRLKVLIEERGPTLVLIIAVYDIT